MSGKDSPQNVIESYRKRQQMNALSGRGTGSAVGGSGGNHSGSLVQWSEPPGDCTIRIPKHLHPPIHSHQRPFRRHRQ